MCVGRAGLLVRLSLECRCVSRVLAGAFLIRMRQAPYLWRWGLASCVVSCLLLASSSRFLEL